MRIKNKFNPAVLLLSIVFLVTGCGPSEEEIQATRKKENDKFYFDKFNQEVISTKANKKWVSNLNINRKNRSGVIYSSELQKEWVGIHPIAFVGNIIEIENYSIDTYIIKAKLSSLNSRIFLKTELYLQLSCGKKEVDRAIKDSRDNFRDRMGEGASVGLIADVEKVSSVFPDGRKSVEDSLLIGIGECVGIFAIPQKYSSFFTDL